MSYTDKMLRDDALKGKMIVVTGGGSGLGKAMTKYFLELGAQVAITSRDLEKLKTTASELIRQTYFPSLFSIPTLLAFAKPRFSVLRIKCTCGYFSATRSGAPSMDALSTTMVSNLK